MLIVVYFQRHDSTSSPLVLLQPITLVPRLRFPFVWLLDGSSSSRSDVFYSDMAALDDQLHSSRNMLVVRSCGAAGLCVVEKLRKGVYALSRLGSLVGEADVIALAAREHDDDHEWEDVEHEGWSWWERARIDEPVSCGGGGGGGGDDDDDDDVLVAFTAGVEDGELIQPSTANPLDIGNQGQSTATSLEDSELQPSAAGPLNIGDDHGQSAQELVAGGGQNPDGFDHGQSAKDLLDGVREQYLHTLYTSKVCLYW